MRISKKRSEELIMLEKGKSTMITFCISIVILFILCTIVVLINFFIKDRKTKETIVGINPITSTKSITMKEPLTVILENEEEKELTQLEGKEEVLQNVEETSMESVMEEEKQTEETQNPVLAEYNGFTTVGKIEIPQTGVDIPILNKVTVEGMKNAPCLLYSTGELNQNGNNLIVGHNFRNGTIFSNNKNLKLGDKIYIISLDGKRVEYTIYDKFITTAEDVSYIKRDTNNKPEITLSCCTDDNEYRIIILARI